jgi:putative peptidoglycan lipid II flippase
MSSPVNPGGNDPAAGIPLPGLIRSTSVVGSMTLLSRVLGLVRDVVLSRWFLQARWR